MPPGPLEFKEESYLTDAPPSDMPTNSQDCYIVNNQTYVPCRELLYRCSCNIYACWPSVTVTNTAAVQTCLLVECGCKMDACWSAATQSACLLTFCHSILHVCWRCASLPAIPAGISLSAVPAGMVSHYQLCLLAWSFIIGHAFWFGTSLSAMSVGVVPHYRPCLLGWCLTKRHAFWCGASLYAMPVGVLPHYRLCLGPPGVLGIWGEWLFIFRELGSNCNNFTGAKEQAHNFGDIGSLAKRQKK